VTSDPRGPMGFAHGEVLNAFLAREPRKSVRSPADLTRLIIPSRDYKFPQVNPSTEQKRSDTNADSFFLSIRIVTVARIEDEWGALGPSVSTSGHIARPSLTIQKKGKTMSYYAYLGPLGEVVRHGASFIAARDGFLIGTYNTFGE
jgi:hypothetical protein